MKHPLRLAAALLTLTALSHSALAHEGHGLPGASHWHSTDVIGYLLAGSLNGAVLFTYISASPGLIMGIYGVSPVTYAWLFGFNAVGSRRISPIR